MSTQHELAAFHQFVGEKLAKDGVNLTPEEVMSEWRLLHPDPDVIEEEVAAIQEALAAVAAGDPGMTLDEFDRDFRLRHSLQMPR